MRISDLETGMEARWILERADKFKECDVTVIGEPEPKTPSHSRRTHVRVRVVGVPKWGAPVWAQLGRERLVSVRRLYPADKFEPITYNRVKDMEAEELIGTEIESEVGPIPVVAVQGGMIIATSDGQDVDRSTWCSCGAENGQVFYTVRGTTTGGEPMLDNRLHHGWACADCREIYQVG